jgi:hypothetical protein
LAKKSANRDSTPAERIDAIFQQAIAELTPGEDDFEQLDAVKRLVYLVIRFRCEMGIGGLSATLSRASTVQRQRRGVEL